MYVHLRHRDVYNQFESRDTSIVVEIGGTFVNANEAEADILRSVEVTTKKSLIVRSDAALRTHATVRIARDTDPAHIVQYRPQYEPERAYLIGYQCGFILRLYQAPEAVRFDIAPTSSGRAEAQRLVIEHFRNRRQALPTSMIASFVEQILSGIILQLRSIPVGLRSDAWLADRYPALCDQQRVAVLRQLNENASALRPEVRDIAPTRVYVANVSMNAAFAAFFARMWNDSLVTEPYRTSGTLAAGESLLKLFDEIPADPAHDRALIEAWGKSLQLTGWYAFIPRT